MNSEYDPTQPKPAKIPTRRESNRQIKPPKRDLPEAAQHQKGKKDIKLTAQLKYCANVIKDFLSKKHSVSLIVLFSYIVYINSFKQ